MPPPMPRCGKGQHEGKRIPCEDQGPCSGPKTRGGREACSAVGRGCSDGAETCSQSKAEQASFQPCKTPRVLSSSTGLYSRGGGAVPRQPVPWPPPPQLLQCLHLPVRGGAGPGEILRGQCGGPWRHGLLNGCFLAVGFEERCGSVGQHRPLVTAKLGPPILKPDLRGKGRWSAGARCKQGCPKHPSYPSWSHAG